ncbi:MAG: hypothetical protein V4546_03600 [Bacteroidota bacterium]
MFKFKTIVISFFAIIYSALIISCENTSDKSDEKEIDSAELRESAQQATLNKIVAKEKPDFILDSLKLKYSIDGQKIINKSVLVHVSRIRDIYTDKDSVDHIVINGRYKNYIDLTCTTEQINTIRKINRGNDTYLIITPVAIRKIDIEYVSNVDDIFDEREELTSRIEIDNFQDHFMIKGRLIKISLTNNSRW